MSNEPFKSIIQRAAALPPEAPHILGVEEGSNVVGEHTEVSAVIDVGEFEDSLRDPVVHAFHQEAVAYAQRLQQEGRDATGIGGNISGLTELPPTNQ